MAEPAALLFDLDGTFVDTADANYAAYAQALAEAGITVDRPTFDKVATGRHRTHFLPILAAGHTADLDAVARRKQELYPGFADLTRVNPALLGLARAVQGRLRLALVTTASWSSVTAVLDAHGLAGLFDVVVTGDDVAAPKPDPEAYRLAADRLGLSPAACLAFEDSDAGVRSAEAAGMTVLRVGPASG